jgi:fibrillarin-like pre-rRNA processing protein
MNPVFPGIYRERGAFFTENLVKGHKVYGEKLVRIEEREFRNWDPSRSKLGAALAKGLKELPVQEGSCVLYLGASTGTTISHISDIVGGSGIVYGVEFAERVFRSLLDLSRKRKNLSPVLADARKPETYKWIEQADAMFVDISQPDETEIAIRNAKIFLRAGGAMFLAVKSQSIDVTKSPEQIYEAEKSKLKSAGFSVQQTIDLEPFEEKHAMIVARRP